MSDPIQDPSQAEEHPLFPHFEEFMEDDDGVWYGRDDFATWARLWECFLAGAAASRSGDF